MNEYTVTLNAEMTLIMTGDEEQLAFLRSEIFPRAVKEVLRKAEVSHQDVHVRDVKVFISKEDLDEGEEY
jgi:hypothetical protein